MTEPEPHKASTENALDALPETAREIAEAIGFAAMLELVDRAGGAKVKVPKRPTEKSELVRFVPLDLVRKLSEHFGGGVLEIPNLRNLKKREERARVLGDLTAGKITVNQAALALGLTSRRIFSLKKDAQAGDSGQMSLFTALSEDS